MLKVPLVLPSFKRGPSLNISPVKDNLHGEPYFHTWHAFKIAGISVPLRLEACPIKLFMTVIYGFL